MEVIRPCTSWLSGAAVSVNNATGRSNTKLILSSNLPEVLEQEPNNTPEQAQRLTVPVGHHRPILARPRTPTISPSRPRRGRPIRSRSSPSGSARRPMPKWKCSIRKAKCWPVRPTTARTSANRFRTSHPGFALRPDLPADGDYTFRLEHLYGQKQGGPQLVYRVELTQKTEDFQILCLTLSETPPRQRRGPARGPRTVGHRRLAAARAQRPDHRHRRSSAPGRDRRAFDHRAGHEIGDADLTAAADAPIGEGEINIVAKSQVAGAEVERVCPRRHDCLGYDQHGLLRPDEPQHRVGGARELLRSA